YQRAGIALARRVGNRGFEWFLLGHLAGSHKNVGDWDEAVATMEEIPDPEDIPNAKVGMQVVGLSMIDVPYVRGDVEMAKRLASFYDELENSDDVQSRVAYHAVYAPVRRMEGRPSEGLEHARKGLEDLRFFGIAHGAPRGCWIVGMDCAFDVGVDEARALIRVVTDLPRGL